MDDERYFTEFFETLEAKTRSWIQSIGRHTHLGPYDLSSGLGNYIYYMHMPLRDAYCGMRNALLPDTREALRPAAGCGAAALPLCIESSFSRSLHVEHLHLEDEGRSGGNAAGFAVAIAELGRDIQHVFRAFVHHLQALGKSLDHLGDG